MTNSSGSGTAGQIGLARPWSPRWLGLTLWVVGLPTAVIAGELNLHNGKPGLVAAIYAGSGWVFLSTGLIAWLRRPENPTGMLLMAAGYALLLPTIAVNSKIPWLGMVGFVFAGSNQVIWAYILLAYPWGTVSTRFDRRAIGAYAVLFVTGGIVTVFITDPAASGLCRYCPADPFQVVTNSSVTDATVVIVTVVELLAGALVLARVIRRWFVASRPARRTLTPVLFGGVIAILSYALLVASFSVLSAQRNVVVSIEHTAEDLIPIGLLIGFVRLRLARAAVGQLAIDLATRLGAREHLQDALAKHLDDPGLVVAFWDPEIQSYVDRDGAKVELAQVVVPRAATLLQREGKPNVAIVHDAALGEDPKMVEQLAAIVRLATDTLAQELPTGTVTFLFGDIERSTELLGQLGAAYGDALVEHRRILRSAVGAWHGTLVECRADEFNAAFKVATHAVRAAIDAQQRLAVHRWPADVSFRVRMGLHTGQAAILDGGYVGIDIHRAARVCGAGHGGQVLLSQTTRDAVTEGDIRPATFRDMSEHHLKGLPQPEHLYQLDLADLPSEFPPLRSGAEATHP